MVATAAWALCLRNPLHAALWETTAVQEPSTDKPGTNGIMTPHCFGRNFAKWFWNQPLGAAAGLLICQPAISDRLKTVNSTRYSAVLALTSFLWLERCPKVSSTMRALNTFIPHLTTGASPAPARITRTCWDGSAGQAQPAGASRDSVLSRWAPDRMGWETLRCFQSIVYCSFCCRKSLKAGIKSLP